MSSDEEGNGNGRHVGDEVGEPRYLREGREIFLLTEPCGRQIIGYCDVDPSNNPVEDERGYVTVWEPLMLLTSMQTGAIQVRPIHSFDWAEELSVYKPSYTPGGERLQECHSENWEHFFQQYVEAEKKRALRGNRVVAASEVSPRDIALSQAARDMKVKH